MICIRSVWRSAVAEDNTFDRIYRIVSEIPYGQVASYGQIASLAGNRRWSRVVGYALNALPSDSELPCHRVVNREGRLAPGFVQQQELLEAEGVEVEDGYVDMMKYGWKKMVF